MTQCFKHGCRSLATHHIAFRAWGEGVPKIKSRAAVEGWLPLPLCYHHAFVTEAKALVAEKAEWWAAIRLQVMEAGQPPPTLQTVVFYVEEGVPEIPLDEPVHTKAEG